MAEQDGADWKRLGGMVAYDGFTRIRRDAYLQPDGLRSEWDVLEQGDTVAVVAFTPRQTVLVFEQYRVGPQRVIRELPGGAVDPGETSLGAGARELEEETGYRARDFFEAGSEWGGANSTRRKHVVVGVGCERIGAPRWGAGEMGTVREIDVADLIPHLLSGDLSDAGEAMRGLHLFARTAGLTGEVEEVRTLVAALLAPDAGRRPAHPAAAGDEWSRRVEAVWSDADDARPGELRAAMARVIAERSDSDPEALFERASVEDYLGEEDAAIPLYRAAIAAGLSGPSRTEAVIQLASSLRNVGEPSAAMALLRGIPSDDPLAPAATAFLALALHDDDKPTPALRLALGELAPHLPAYARAVARYAADLPARPRIRAIAVGLLVDDGWVLAEEYPATPSRGAFLRAPGGGIDVGETAAAAIGREIAEELGATVDEATLIAVTENIFERAGGYGHEIAHVFGIRSADLERLPRGERLPVLDSDTTVGWYRIADLLGGSLPFYPAGIADLAAGRG